MKGEGVDDIYVLSMPSFMYEVSYTPFFLVILTLELTLISLNSKQLDKTEDCSGRISYT